MGSIARDEFVSQVTEGSRDNWVVVLLFQERHAADSPCSCFHAIRRTDLSRILSVSRASWRNSMPAVSLFDIQCMLSAILLWMCRVMACQVVKACMQELAAQYKHVKFLTIPSTECIPNYPDENLPTLLVYHNGQCRRTIVGTQTLGYDRISPESEQPLSPMTLQITHLHQFICLF